MKKLGWSAMLAVVVSLLPGVANAQPAAIQIQQNHLLGYGQFQAVSPQPDPTVGPGWNEFRHLASRLEAVEAENRRLRIDVNRPSELAESNIQLAGHAESCSDCECGRQAGCCDCAIDDNCSSGKGWGIGPVHITPFGYVAADMIASDKAYAILGGPLFLLPSVPSNVPDSRFTFTAQQTTLGFNITGPDLGSHKSSAIIAFNFFGDRPVQNNPGVFFVLGYLQLRNDYWRFWAGQDGDAIGRQNTNSPAWTNHKQSGNFGQVRPGFRVERFFQHSEDMQSSIYFGVTQQVVLDFIANPQVAGTDNGWPNVEFRWELALGQDCDGARPLMFAVGGLVGETRAVDFVGNPEANVSSAWAVIPELRLQVGRWGFQGEAFAGEAVGTYNGAIGQSLNTVTDEAIYTEGGFGEIFCNVTPCFTVAIGYGIDNPRDGDLGSNQRSRNETYWTNAIWKMSEQWETRCEIARQKTNYIAPSESSKAMQYLLSLRYNF